MFNQIIFSQNLKLLRNTHNLSNSHLSDLLSLKSRTSISDFEAARTLPSAKILSDIADLFTVSLDWLAGRSDTPYTDELMAKIEDKFWNFTSPTMEQEANIILDIPPLPENYKDIFKRSNNYSLEIRANIMFLLSVIFITAKAIVYDNENPYQTSFSRISKHDKILQADIPILQTSYEDNSPYLKLLSKNYSLPTVQILEKLLTQEIDKPLFDIMTQPIKMCDWK